MEFIAVRGLASKLAAPPSGRGDAALGELRDVGGKEPYT